MICVSKLTANVMDERVWHQHWLLTLLETDGIELCMQLRLQMSRLPAHLNECWSRLSVCWYSPLNKSHVVTGERSPLETTRLKIGHDFI